MRREKRLKIPVLFWVLGITATSCGMKQEQVPDETPQGQELQNALPEWDTETLLDTDFLLYNVNCGAEETENFAGNEKCGLYQSVSDREYGMDAETGKNWGYRSSDALIREEDSLGEGFTAWKWVIGREADISQAEICYDFELPDGKYLVTLGFYNPFGVRKADVECEGTQQVSGEQLLKYELKEVRLETAVSDGELNLKVYNSQGKNFMDTPILSYIRVAVEPEYDKALLAAALEKFCPGQEVYTETSYQAFQGAYDAAAELLEQEQADSSMYKEKFLELRGTFEMLELKYRYNDFYPGEQWRDTENNVIQAHGGQVQRLTIENAVTGEPEEKWVWVGEDKTLGYRGGICAYSSDDLYNWQFEGVIMRNVSSREQLDTDSYFQEVYAGYTPEQLDNVYLALNDTRAVIERPKLIYNEKTRQYVLWFHADGPTEQSNADYAAACAGVAVSDSVFGPYRFIDRYRLDLCPEDQEDKYPQSRGMARDMNLFQDVDGTAYIIYSSEENLTLYISKLNEEFTYLSAEPDEAVYGKDFIRLFPGAQREAPALFLRDGKYYLMTSGCTGWAPNQARYYTADSVLGEWTDMGDPCIHDEDHTTFHSQSTCIFQEPESGVWIYMGDRWNPDDLGDSRYIWLPIDFDEKGNMSISYVTDWNLER